MPIEFEYYSDEVITGADFGHSPWSESNISDNNGQEGFLIVGEANGNVTGWEWNNTKVTNDQFTPQEKMNLDGLFESVVHSNHRFR